MNPQQPNQQLPPNQPPVQNTGTLPQNPAPAGYAAPPAAAPYAGQPVTPTPIRQTPPPPPQPNPTQTADTRKPKAPKNNPNSTQNTLLISEIRDGIVIMNDGSFRAVVMSKSINFDLMSPQERESVEFSYQNFLNSLYFDIQIFIRSTKVDLRPYIDKLDKLRGEQDNMLLALLMEDYIQFIDVLAQETNIMDKQFYIIIPFYLEADLNEAGKKSKKLLSGLLKKPATQVVTINESDLEKAKQEMRNRVQSVMAGLAQVGVQSIPLDTEELIELYYDSYNPDTSTRQRIKNFDDLTAPVISKGDGNATQPNLDRELL